MEKTILEGNKLIAGLTKKCFMVKELLLIDIMKMCTGRKLEDLDLDDAGKLTLIGKSGEENYRVEFDKIYIGDIVCDFPDHKIIYTFTPHPYTQNNNNS